MATNYCEDDPDAERGIWRRVPDLNWDRIVADLRARNARYTPYSETGHILSIFIEAIEAEIKRSNGQ